MGTTSTVRGSVYAALAAAAVLLATAPGPATSLRTLAEAGSARDVTEPLVALLALLAWLCAAYLLAVAALTAASRLPGTAGAVLGALTRVVVPAGLRRALELGLGVTLAVGALGGTAVAETGLEAQVRLQAPAVPAPVLAPEPGTTPSLDHPVVPESPAPDLDWPGGTRPTTPAAPVTPVGVATPAVDQEVVVQPGDSLWSLAQERLEQQAPDGRVSDAQVAQAWPSWWQANREVVGDDPDLLQPGQRLTPPGEQLPDT